MRILGGFIYFVFLALSFLGTSWCTKNIIMDYKSCDTLKDKIFLILCTLWAISSPYLSNVYVYQIIDNKFPDSEIIENINGNHLESNSYLYAYKACTFTNQNNMQQIMFFTDNGNYIIPFNYKYEDKIILGDYWDFILELDENEKVINFYPVEHSLG